MVRDVQQALGALGFYDGPVDGLISGVLTAAVGEFQQRFMRKGLFKGWVAKGHLTDGTYAKIIEMFSQRDAAYADPGFYPVKLHEMREARERLLHTEEMLEDPPTAE